MKKYIALSLVLSIMMLGTACNKNQSTQETVSTDTAQTEHVHNENCGHETIGDKIDIIHITPQGEAKYLQ